jgi:hypothetical protein
MFERNLMPVPEICSDSEDALNQHRDKTLIAVGLFTNSLTCQMATPTALYGLALPTDLEHLKDASIFIRTDDLKGDSTAPEWKQQFKLQEGEEYILIAKTWDSTHERHVLICAGVTEGGTLAAAKLLNGNWKGVYRHADTEDAKLLVRSRTFAAVYAFQPGRNTSARVRYLRVGSEHHARQAMS